MNMIYPGHYPVIDTELWTAKQRQMCSLHEISYRACFKAELPEFFISRFSKENEIVYDPFAGRGTTAIQASLMGRRFIANDINPLMKVLAEPRTNPPPLEAVQRRLHEIDLTRSIPKEEDEPEVEVFFSPQTLAEIRALKSYLLQRRLQGTEDRVDQWIRMVATNRLTGHSKGFFSVYTLPPNQAVTPERQKKINEKYKNPTDEYRDVKNIILKKSKALLKEVPTPWPGVGGEFLNQDAANTYLIPENQVHLIVTSPPFLDQVQYHQDNWLRCWFNHINTEEVAINLTQYRSIEHWSEAMQSVFEEFRRILVPGGYGAFEVGEVRKGKIRLDDYVFPLIQKAGLEPIATYINRQQFTKTANIWGISNNSVGTNTNRVILFSKPL
jgi:hypothetical protein